MNFRSVLVAALQVAIGAAMIAGLVHIAAVLLVPLFASHDAFARLSALGPVNATIGLEQSGPAARLIPFQDPDVAAAFCRYDLSAGPLRVKAPADGAGFASLSFHSRHGDIFYALTDKAATRGALEALVVTEEQLRALEANDDEDSPTQDLRVVSTAREGFVLMREFSLEPSLFAQAAGEAKRLTCATEETSK